MTPLGERLMAVDQIADYLRGGGAALLPTDTL
ncbi:translation factor, partial [Pseudomonas sp. HMWF031]